MKRAAVNVCGLDELREGGCLEGDCAEEEQKILKLSTISPITSHRISSSRKDSHSKRQRKSLEETQRIWRGAKAVCFDVDSTVCRDEAIDELAKFCGVGEEVAAWTQKAMNGNFSFRQALSARLDLITPSRQQLESYVRQHPPKLTPGIKEWKDLFRELVYELQRRKVPVYLVSGGFTRIILPVAQILNIPEHNVFANVLHFDENGDYSGFDDSQPTSDSGGKTEVCGMLKRKFLYQSVVMVGDGATDLEACPPADAFIGFGGNQVRDRVRREAGWFVYDFQEMLMELKRPSC